MLNVDSDDNVVVDCCYCSDFDDTDSDDDASCGLTRRSLVK